MLTAVSHYPSAPTPTHTNRLDCTNLRGTDINWLKMGTTLFWWDHSMTGAHLRTYVMHHDANCTGSVVYRCTYVGMYVHTYTHWWHKYHTGPAYVAESTTDQPLPLRKHVHILYRPGTQHEIYCRRITPTNTHLIHCPPHIVRTLSTCQNVCTVCKVIKWQQADNLDCREHATTKKE